MGRQVLLYAAVLAAGITGIATAQETDQNPPVTAPAPDARDKIFYPGDTESFKPLASKLFHNVLMDQKDIWTSPFHMNRSNAKWWILFGAAAVALIETDRHTINAFENSPGQIRWAQHISNIGAGYTLGPIAASFYIYGVLRDDTKAREVGVLSGEALLDSLIVVEVLKTAAGRERPNSTQEPSHFFDGGDGFPSGHSIESWALASVIAHEFGRRSKWVPVIAYSLASLVSCARFAAQAHYASDIVVGAGMGWFIGRFVYQTHMDHSIHKYGWLKPEIMPQFDPVTHSYGAAVVFGGK